MEDNYKIPIIIGVVGLATVLILIYWNEIGKFFMGIRDWFLYDLAGYSRFYTFTAWDWLIWIGALIFIVVYCCFKSVSKK